MKTSTTVRGETVEHTFPTPEEAHRFAREAFDAGRDVGCVELGRGTFVVREVRS